MSEIATRNPQMELVARVRTAEFQEQIALALPEGINPSRFTRSLVTVLLQNPDLVNADRASLFLALISAAAWGLIPDGRLAALVVRKGKVVFQPMVDGLRERVADFGWNLRSGVVYQHDKFDYTDEPPTLTHTRVRAGRERGPLIAAWAIAEHAEMGRRQRVFWKEDIQKRRDKAQTQAIWNEFEPEMWEKTVSNSLAKDLPTPDRFRRVAALAEVDDSLTALYGPEAHEALEIPPAGDPADAAPSEEADVDTAGHQPGVVGGEGWEAADASLLDSAPAASDPDDYAQRNADAAGRIKLPVYRGWPFSGKTIAEAHAGKPDVFLRWVEWALGQMDYAEGGEQQLLGDALRAWCPVYAPELVA